MKLWVDSVLPPPNEDKYAWMKSLDMAIFSVTLNERKGCPHEGIDIGHVIGTFENIGGVEFLEWLEKTRRNYPVRVHTTDPFEKEPMEEFVRRNGWDRLMHYTVGFKVDGRAYVEARGKSPDEAAQKAVVDFASVDLGELECVDFKAVIAYDENDEIIDDYDIANGSWFEAGEEQDYLVGFAVDCRAYVTVLAESPADAVWKAESDFSLVALGNLEVNCWKPVHAEDEQGKLYDSEQDFHYIGMEIPKEYAYNGTGRSGENSVLSQDTFKAVAEQLRDAVALEYKGILFDDWTVDEETKGVWAEMCQCCADKYKVLLSDELSDGGMGACGIKGCDVVGMDSDYERHYYVDFKLEHIQVLDATQFMERYPELSDLDLKLFDAKIRLNEEAERDGPDGSGWKPGVAKPHGYEVGI